MTNAREHLANAKNYIAKGEDFYRKAAEEIVAAMKEDPTLGYGRAAKDVGKSEAYVRRLVTAHTNASRAKDGEFVVDWQSGDTRSIRTQLRDAEPEQIAEQFLSDPEIRAKVSRAQDIAHAKVEERSRKAEREALGDDLDDQLRSQQKTHDAEAEIFKARRSLIEVLRLLNETDAVDDPWREGFLHTLDDLDSKIAAIRILLQGGDLDEELTKLLAEGV